MQLATFTPFTALAGGALIGLAAVILLLANGRIAGVSGIAAGLLTRDRGEFGWRAAFIAGLWIGSILFGIGWGLSGLCPGPAITDLVTGRMPIVLFVAAMFAGALLRDALVARTPEKERGRQRTASACEAGIAYGSLTA